MTWPLPGLINLFHRLTTGKSDALATQIKIDKNKGARVDPRKLVTAEERALANIPRIVQDPVLLKTRAAAVSFFINFVCYYHNMRKVYLFGTS